MVATLPCELLSSWTQLSISFASAAFVAVDVDVCYFGGGSAAAAAADTDRESSFCCC